MTGESHVTGSPGSDSVGESDREDQPALALVAEGATQIVWEDRWHEEEIFANRVSFYLLAQSFLVFAAVESTLSNVAACRWLPTALTIDLAGLILTLVFWYALTENLRRLDHLKEIVAEGSPEVGVLGYREIGDQDGSPQESYAARPAVPTFDSFQVVTVVVAGSWDTRLAGNYVDRAHRHGNRDRRLARR